MLQTHIRYPVAGDVLTQVRAFQFEMARADLHENTTDEAVDILVSLRQADLATLAVLFEPDQVRALSQHLDWPIAVEYRNEPDLDRSMTPTRYRRGLEDMALACAEAGWPLYAGVASNTIDRGYAFVKACWPFPEGVRVSWHRYAPTYHADEPQHGSHTRQEEIAKIKAIIGARPWGISECGYAVLAGQLTEAQQADELRKEMAFAATTDADFWGIFQLGCGPGTSREENYGIRRFDGTWRLSASVLIGGS